MKVEHLLERKDVKEKIIELIQSTRDTRKEHLFNFCMKHGDVNTTDITKGKEFTVGNEDKCPEGTKIIGGFHTHTKLTKDLDVIPSSRDLIKSIKDDLDFFCIGANKDNIGIVRCFNKEDILLEMNKILQLTKKGKNLNRSARHLVGHMLGEKIYLDNHSYSRLYNLEN